MIEAQDRLVEMNISDYPRMKKDGRKKFYRDMRRLAFPPHMQKQMSFDDFISITGI